MNILRDGKMRCLHSYFVSSGYPRSDIRRMYHLKSWYSLLCLMTQIINAPLSHCREGEGEGGEVEGIPPKGVKLAKSVAKW